MTRPKTEHHTTGESRIVPIFLELRNHLEEPSERAASGWGFVLTKYRDTDRNLRTHLKQIASTGRGWRRGQSCSGTCKALARRNWWTTSRCPLIGTSQPVTAKQYLKVTGKHFEQAANVQSDAESSLQNPQQQSHECTAGCEHGA